MALTMSQEELLNFAIQNGMLDLDNVQNEIDMRKKQEILDEHPYKIWEGKNGKWYTYLPDDTKGRVQKERLTEKAIKDVVYKFWKQQEDDPTVRQLFKEHYRTRLENEYISKACYDRYELDFNRYFEEMGSKKVRNISARDIDEFMTSSVAKYNLTAKAYSNLRTIVYGIFKSAKKRELVPFSITEVMSNVDIPRKAFKSSKKAAETQIFTESELPLIIDYLENHVDKINLGLLLMFKTGLRIGELATIRIKNVDNYVIDITSTETRYKDARGNTIYGVKDSPKTEAGFRQAIIPTKYEWVIDKLLELNPDGEFLFENKGQRIKTYSFRRRLGYICEAKIKIKPKSPHKIRKTYCTILLDNNVEESLITEVVGHVDIETTRSYYEYNRKDIDSKRSRLDLVAGL